MSLPFLPVELLDQIMGYLDPADVARLMACNNRQLVLHYERRLYIQPDAQNHAMLAACKHGLVRVIRRLVLDYGAPVSILHRTWRFGPRILGARAIDDGVTTQLTLYIAAASGHVDAFSELVRLGARIDAPGVRSGGQTDLLEHIFSPVNDWALLHLFYDKGLDPQVFPENRVFIMRPLLQVIRAPGNNRPPLKTIQMLLDRGAGSSVNEVYQSATPLTAAMRQQEYDPIPVLDLLLSAGAAINGLRLEPPVTAPTHIPIFAAVEAMATRGVTSPLEWCFQRGADVNLRGEVQDSRTEIRYHATPALFYIICVDFWAGRPWDPTEGLKFLLKRGAQIDISPDDLEQMESKSHAEGSVPQRYTGSIWCLEYLLAKWGMAEMLNTPSYRRMIEYLIHLNAEREDATAAETLSRCESGLRGNPELDPLHDRSAQYSSAREATICAWEVLVKEMIIPAYRLDLTRLLAQYIVYKGSHIEPVEHLTRATIQVLLDAGADINAHLIDTDDGSTLLHQLCREVGRVWSDAPKGCGPFCTFQAHVRSFSLITHLLNRGADRSIRTRDGRTAKDMFLDSVDPRRCERLARLGSMLG